MLKLRPKADSYMKRISSKQRIILIVFGLFLCVILLEIGLRIGGFVFLSLQEYRNRISIMQRGTYRILCLGESTTAMGGEHSYPRQLEKILNQRDIGVKFSVINKGIPATHTEAILAQLEENLNEYRPDMVMTMMGFNDRGDVLPYGNIFTSKKIPLKIYKLAGILWYHIKPIGKRADILAGINNLAQSSNFKEQQERMTREGKYLELGWRYCNQGDYDKAEEIIKESIEINPKNDIAYLVLGQCYWIQGEYDRAEEIFKEAIEINPESDRLYSGIAIYYEEQGKDNSAEEYFRKANSLRLETYNPITRNNYQRLKEIVTQRGIRLVCVQYPMRGIEPLKRMFKTKEGIIFVDNEMVFKKALKEGRWDEYFRDMIGGDFGHCTPKGNRLLAKNIADVILGEYFNR